VQEGLSLNSAQTVTTIMERGVPDHHKITEKAPITVTFKGLSTGLMSGYLTASGSTVPMLHMELRHSAGEIAAASGFYYQFHGVAAQSIKFTENKQGNSVDLSFVALAMTGPTASGYLS
jgi:hypothetical protein